MNDNDGLRIMEEDRDIMMNQLLDIGSTEGQAFIRNRINRVKQQIAELQKQIAKRKRSEAA